MTTLRRILTAATLVLGASSLVSASPVISYGYDPSTGFGTVTQTVTISSTPFNVSSPTGLATFAGFASLGLGTAVYEAGDTTMDYEFTDTVNNFQVTNGDSTTDTVNFGLNSVVTLDGSTTLTTNNPQKDQQHVCGDIANSNDSITLSGTCSGTFALVNVTDQSIASGATYTLGGLPVTYVLGDGINLCDTFGDTDKGAGCSVVLGNDSQYSGVTPVSFGVQDSGSNTFSAVGSSNDTLTFTTSTSFSGIAEITYEYTIPSGIPEPTTMGLLGIGLLGLGLVRGKKITRS